MPYYRHDKGTEPIDGKAYETIAAARVGIDPKSEIVTFLPSEEESADWRSREYDRFMSGTYLEVPWRPVDRYDQIHYTHLSLSHPGLIAYTASEEHGVQDRQTRMAPGRYLQRFYAEHASNDQIAEWIAACKAEHLQLQIARTPDDVVTVYTAKDGPTSCMDHRLRVEIHPSIVYGDSDLGVAYLGDLESETITARCVVWPDRQLYDRAYGDKATLIQLLRAHGYTKGAFEGARIRLITNSHGRIVVPYVDGFNSGSLSDRWITLDGRSGVSLCETCGYALNDDDQDDEDDNQR